MKPNKKQAPPPAPDPIPDISPNEELGGTDIDAESSREPGLVESIEGDEGSGGGYGRPRSDDDEDER